MSQASAANTRVCLFELNEQTFAVEGIHSRQFVRIEHLTHVPHAPEPLLGVFSVRGQVRALIDLGRLIGAAEDRATTPDTAAIFEYNGDTVTLAVDRAIGFPTYAPTGARPLLRSSDAKLQPYSKGVISVDGKEAVLLDLERIVESLNAIVNQPA